MIMTIDVVSKDIRAVQLKIAYILTTLFLLNQQFFCLASKKHRSRSFL